MTKHGSPPRKGCRSGVSALIAGILLPGIKPAAWQAERLRAYSRIVRISTNPVTSKISMISGFTLRMTISP